VFWIVDNGSSHRPANRDIPRGPDGALPECWLLAEWPPEADEPTDYWLSTLPEDTPIEAMVRLAKIRWRVDIHLPGFSARVMGGINRAYPRGVPRSGKVSRARQAFYPRTANGLGGLQ